MATATATATTGADVVADGRSADDGNGAAAGVVDPARRVAASATDFVPTGATAPAANGNRAIGGRRAVTAVTVIGHAQPARAASIGATATAHVGRVITATVAAGIGAASLAAQRAGARPGRATMPTVLTAQTAATTTATAVKSTRDTAAATAAGSGIGGHADVVKGQDAGVENPPGHCPCGTVATVAARSRHQATGNHQAIKGHGSARGNFNHPRPVLTVENYFSHAVVVQVAIDGDVLADQQFGRQLHRHAGVEGDDIAVLRRGDGGTQRADTGVAVVGSSPGRQAPLILTHGRGRQHVGAFDVAGDNFQVPVAADPGAVAGSGYITAGQLREGIDKTQASLTFGGVAAVDHDVAAGIHVLADFRQHRTAGRDVVGRQIAVAQPQVARVAVSNDLHRTDALMGIQIIGNLLQTVPARVQLNHLSARRHAFEQAVGVLDPGIDEHHALPRYGNRC